MAAIQTLGPCLPRMIDESGLKGIPDPFPILRRQCGPGGIVNATVDLTGRRHPFPAITTMLISQHWTAMAWQHVRIDLTTTTDRDVVRIGTAIVLLVPDSPTRLRFAINFADTIAADLHVHRTLAPGNTIGTGIAFAHPSDTADHRLRATFDWQRELIEGNAIGNLAISVSALGNPEYSWGVVSQPWGDNGSRVRLQMTGSLSGKPVPTIGLSVPLAIAPSLRAYMRLSPDQVEVGISCRIRPETRVQFGLESSTDGIALRLRFQHRLFALSMPCIINEDPNDLRTVVLCIAIPATLLTIWNIMPALAARWNAHHMSIAHRDIGLKINRLRARRRAAQEQQDAMRTEANTRRSAEQLVNGLVIQSATFIVANVDPLVSARALSRGSEFASSFAVDVPLQFWVQNSRLDIAGGVSKRAMLGFYCPFAPGVQCARPLLLVEYTFNGRQFACTAAEMEPLHLPDQRHALP